MNKETKQIDNKIEQLKDLKYDIIEINIYKMKQEMQEASAKALLLSQKLELLLKQWN